MGGVGGGVSKITPTSSSSSVAVGVSVVDKSRVVCLSLAAVGVYVADGG